MICVPRLHVFSLQFRFDVLHLRGIGGEVKLWQYKANAFLLAHLVPSPGTRSHSLALHNRRGGELI